MAEVRKMPSGPRGGRYMGPRGKFNKNSFKRLLKYILKYKVQYIVVILCILVSSIVQVYNQVFLKTLIDDYISPLLLDANPVYDGLIRFILTMAGFYLIGVVCNFIYNRIMVYVSQKILKNIRDDMFTHMEDLPISYFDKNSHGDIMSRYTNDTDTLRQLVGNSIPSFIDSIFSIISIFIAMLYLNAFLTLLVVVGVILMSIITKNIAKMCSKYFTLQQDSLGNLNGYIEEMVEGAKVVKVFTHEEKSKEDFDKLNNKLCKHSTKALTYGNMMGPINNNVGNLIYVIIAFIGSILAIKTSSFTLGAISSFLLLTRSFINPVSQITQQFNSIVMALAGASRIFELMDEKKEENNGKVSLVYASKNGDSLKESATYTGIWAWKTANELIELKGDISFSNVNFGYEKEKQVLYDISLHANPGQKIAFVGATGSGKTTITNLLNRFYDIDSGIITYDGIDIREINKSDLRISLGMVLQDVNLFTGTILENVRYGRLDATDLECINACKLANADDFISLLPDGYNTIVTDNGQSLSQGQRQLLSIARCAVANPPVMILDEATSSVDTKTEKDIQGGMDKLMEGRTVLVIAHRLSTVHNAKAIMVLENGKIIECGDHFKLMKEKGKYYQLYTGNSELE